jgi:hypothetical protein
MYVNNIETFENNRQKLCVCKQPTGRQQRI